MSDAFERLLRGEINVKEYVQDLERRIRERHEKPHPPSNPVEEETR